MSVGGCDAPTQMAAMLFLPGNRQNGLHPKKHLHRRCFLYFTLYYTENSFQRKAFYSAVFPVRYSSAFGRTVTASGHSNRSTRFLVQRWAGCFLSVRFRTVCAVNAQTWLNSNPGPLRALRMTRSGLCAVRRLAIHAAGLRSDSAAPPSWPDRCQRKFPRPLKSPKRQGR